MQKLAIVGSHPKTRMDAPFADLSYDIWCFNEAVEVYKFPRWTACMQMHRKENYTASSNWVDDFKALNTHHWEWLQQDHGADHTIWMQAADERVPNSKAYPLAEIMAQPWAKRKWFTSTAAFSLALGIYLGYKTIEIYGVELTSNTEYYAQLHNWQYWVGVADGLGIDLILKSGEMHFTDRLYAYEGETQIEREWFTQRAGSANGTWGKMEFETAKIKRNLDQAMLGRKFEDVQRLIIELREHCIKAGKFAGTQAEAERYAKREDPISRQEFELRLVKAQNDCEGYRANMYHSGGKAAYVFDVWKEHASYQALQQLRIFIDETNMNAYNFGAHIGIGDENEEYTRQYDARLFAVGGKRAIMARQEVTA